MAEVKWIRLSIDMFNNRKIKYLRSLPEGNNIILIWVMLLTIAGRCNSGGLIFLTETVGYTTKMLAAELDFDENTIILAINALKHLGMIDYYDENILIAGWDEHQNIDGLDKIKEQNRVRKQRQREKERIELGCHVTCHADVTPSHATDIDIDKELDIDKDKKHIVAQSTTAYPYREVIAYLNSEAETAFKDTSKDSRRYIKARFNEGFTLDDFKKVIDIKVAEWKGTDMSTYLRPATLFGTKFESYLNQKKATKKRDEKPTNQFQNFPQREVDYDALVMQEIQNMGDGEHGKEI